MAPSRLEAEDSLFPDGNIQEVVVLSGLAEKYAVGWAVVPCGLELNPVDVGELLQVVESDLFVGVALNDFVYLLSQLFLDSRVLPQEINHHREEECCRVSPSHQEGRKLVDQAFLGKGKLCLIVHVFVNQGLHYICALFLHLSLFDLLDSGMKDLRCFCSEQVNLLLYGADLFRQSELIHKFAQEHKIWLHRQHSRISNEL